MLNIEIYFDGYCPESELQGKQVEMKLNEDDFWESEETGLQMTVFPPFATILRWRGKGKFKSTSNKASEMISGLLITEALKDDHNEIFPDKNKIINDKIALQNYLIGIFANKEEANADKLNDINEIFKRQETHLESIKKMDWERLLTNYSLVKNLGYTDKFKRSESYKNLFENITELKLIFAFDWTSWENGKQNLNTQNYDYTRSSLLELSMYLTTIFRAERFNEGIVEEMFRNRTMDNIFNSIRMKIQ